MNKYVKTRHPTFGFFSWWRPVIDWSHSYTYLLLTPGSNDGNTKNVYFPDPTSAMTDVSNTNTNIIKFKL